MANVTVIGAQWGDEGKGKVIDWLADRADVVVRFQGGNNAGHTIVVGNNVYKFSLLPSGVVQGKLSVIGNGVVVDPWSLLDEIERVARAGPGDHPRHPGRWPTTPASSCRCTATWTGAREARAGANKIGTTGRGIGPAYEDKVGRRAIRFVDLDDRGGAEGQDRAPAGPPRAAAARARPAGHRRRRPASTCWRRSRPRSRPTCSRPGGC